MRPWKFLFKKWTKITNHNSSVAKGAHVPKKLLRPCLVSELVSVLHLPQKGQYLSKRLPYFPIKMTDRPTSSSISLNWPTMVLRNIAANMNIAKPCSPLPPCPPSRIKALFWPSSISLIWVCFVFELMFFCPSFRLFENFVAIPFVSLLQKLAISSTTPIPFFPHGLCSFSFRFLPHSNSTSLFQFFRLFRPFAFWMFDVVGLSFYVVFPFHYLSLSVNFKKVTLFRVPYVRS